MKILMVLNLRDRTGSDAPDGGIPLREFVIPYFFLRDVGAEVTLAARVEARPPPAARFADSASRTDAERRFTQDADATAALAGMRKLGNVSTADFDAVFYPAGDPARWEWRTEH